MSLPRFIRALLQPHYLYRPLQLFRRFYREWLHTTPSSVTARLPWGHRLRIDPTEHIGRSVWLHGLYDATVCEILWRLSTPGMRAVDIGANVGVMTSVLAHRGAPGVVYSFEPHPTLYPALSRNVHHLRQGCDAHIYPFPFALSHYRGTASLVWDSSFQKNRGTATLATQSSEGVRVPCTTLDTLFPSSHLDILKIDVEGHESLVVDGAQALLSDRRVSHILYECHQGFDSVLHGRLQRLGYTSFGIRSSLRGPILLPMTEKPSSTSEISSSFLATRHPAKANECINPNGWKCLTTVEM